MGSHIGKVDPSLNSWIINWNHHIFRSGDWKNYFNDSRFYPYQKTLLTGDHLFLLSLVRYPICLIFNNPVLSYNFLLFLAFPLSCFAAYKLARYYFKDIKISIVVGLIWGFAPFRFGNFEQIQIVSSYFLPLSILAFEKLLKLCEARKTDSSDDYKKVAVGGLIFGLLISFAGLMTVYQLAYGTVILGAILIYRLLVDKYKFNPKKCLLGLGVAVFAVIAILGPFYFRYYKFSKDHNAKRSIKTSQLYNADLTSVFHAAPGNLLYGQSCPFLNKFSTKASPCHETSMFQGITVLLLALIALIKMIKRKGFVFWGLRLDSQAIFFVLMLLISYIFALGPKLKILGNETPLVMPYTFLYKIFPLAQATRVPGRFSMLYSLFLALIAGKGLKLISPKSGKPLLVILVSLVILLESFSGPLALASAREIELDVYKFLRERDDIEVIIEFPIGVPAIDNNMHNIRSLDATIYHGKKTINGYGGYFVDGYNHLTYYFTRHFPSEESLEVLSRLGVDAVVVRLDSLGPEVSLDKIYEDEDFKVYKLDQIDTEENGEVEFRVTGINLRENNKVLDINAGFYNDSDKIWVADGVPKNIELEIRLNGRRIRRHVVSHPLFVEAESSKSVDILIDNKILGLKRRAFVKGDVIEIFSKDGKLLYNMGH
ncbi:hypothetical protein GF357_04680 [Candidatus Dojkabacteria bacterium]|nr:hypothetical protein [Candidatus Dojkabacteria bacterium]